MHIYMGVSMMLRISNKFDLFDRYYRDCVIVIYERRESDCNLKKKKKKITSPRMKLIEKRANIFVRGSGIKTGSRRISFCFERETRIPGGRSL